VTCAAMIFLAGCTAIQPGLSINTARESSAGRAFSASAGETIASTWWAFGDGETSTELQPSHVYAERGTYTVNLTVGFDDGTFESASTSIEVGHDWHVYDDLRSAIEQAEVDDTLFVYQSTYSKILITKELELVGVSGCVIESLRYENTAGSINGFTLRCATDNPIDGTIDRFEYSALTLIESSTQVSNCTISDNTIDIGYGAGVYAVDSPAVFEECTFAANNAGFGGGAVCASGTHAFPSFYACMFTDNQSRNGGGAILIRVFTDGCLLPSATFPVIERCVFAGNRVTGYQEGLAIGGAIHIGSGCSVTLIDNTFVNNSPTDVCYEDI